MHASCSLIRNRLLGIAFLLFFGITSQAQHTCGFSCDHAHNEALDAKLKQYILSYQSSESLATDTSCMESQKPVGKFQIPVVVHLIDYSRADEDVFSAISRLNEIFAGNDGNSVVLDIEVVMASLDPSGAPTTGVVRHTPGTNPSTVSWDTKRYMNIFLVDLGGISGIATFPSEHGKASDGVRVKNLNGGLLAHEVGHYFGLYHTFDGGGCVNNDCLSDGDKVCDTPPKRPNMFNGDCFQNTCSADGDDPSANNPFRISGDQPDDWSNFMDYSGPCWASYTQGQKERMRASIITFRSSLLGSFVAPNNPNQDISLGKIIYPTAHLCNKVSDVEVEITNNSVLTASNVPFTLEINGVVTDNLIFAGPLNAGETTTITFPNITFNDGDNSILVYTDGDNVTSNNLSCNSTTTQTTEVVIDDILTDFESDNGIWHVENPDRMTNAFTAQSNSSCSDNGNTILAYEPDQASSFLGNDMYLVSKKLDLTGATTAFLTFQYAHAVAGENISVGTGFNPVTLEFGVSTDCGRNYSTDFTKSGTELTTSNFDVSGGAPFYPEYCEDWRSATVDLSAYAGQEVILRFNAHLSGANSENIFLDNIDLFIDKDCEGTPNGPAEIVCGVCSGGSTGIPIDRACKEVCGNGIDDDLDGLIDEACEPVPCNSQLYLTNLNQVFELAEEDWTVDESQPLYPKPPFTMDALAFNPEDNTFYGFVRSGTYSGQIARVDINGDFEILGGVPGVSLSLAGGMGRDNIMYITSGSNLYQVDVTTMESSRVMGMGMSFSDIAVNPSNGLIYGERRGKIIEVDPVNKTVREIGSVDYGGANAQVSTSAAVFFSPTGKLILQQWLNDGKRGFFTVDLNTFESEYAYYDNIWAQPIDGTSCPYSLQVDKAASESSITPGQEFEYTFDFYNETGFPLIRAVFADTLPEGLSVVGVVSSDVGPLTNDISTEPGLIRIENLTIPKGESQLVVKVKLDEKRVCSQYTLINQASVSNLPQAIGGTVLSNDPNTVPRMDPTEVEVLPGTGSELVEIELNPVEKICQGERLEVSVANTTGGGIDPEYHWYYNGTLLNNLKKTSRSRTSWADGDSIAVILKSSNSCFTIQEDTAYVILDVQEPADLAVAIEQNCPDPISFSAIYDASSVGDGLFFLEWFVNGESQGHGSNTFSSPLVVEGDEIAVSIFSDHSCLTSNSAADTLLVETCIVPDLEIEVDKDTICAGDTVTYKPIFKALGPIDSLLWKFGGDAIPLDLEEIIKGGERLYYNKGAVADSVKVIYPTGGEKDVILYKTGIDADTVIKLGFVDVFDYPIAELATLEDSLSYCAGSDVALIEGSAVTGASYVWFKDDLPTTEIGLDFTSLTEGEYRFEVTKDGCTTLSDSLKIYELPNVAPNVSMSASETTICEGREVIFVVTDSTDAGVNPSFEWYVNGLAIAGSDTNALIKNDLVDGDSVAVVITSNETCPEPLTDTASVTIKVEICPFDVFINRDKICLGDTVVYTTMATNLILGDSVLYDFGSGAEAIGMTAVTKPVGTVYYRAIDMLGPIEVLYSTIGQKDVVVYKNGSDPDTLAKTAIVEVFGYPNAEIATLEDSLSYCSGSNVAQIEGALVTDATYQWYKDDIVMPGKSSINLTGITKGEYRLEVTKDGCSTLSDSLLVFELPVVIPEVKIKADRDTICPGEPILYEVIDSLNSGESPIFQWKVNTITKGVGATISLSTLQKGDSVYVEMYATNTCQTIDVAVSNTHKPLVKDHLDNLSLVSGVLRPCQYDKGVEFTLTQIDGDYSWNVKSGDATLRSTARNIGVVDVGELSSEIEVNVKGECDAEQLLLPIVPHKRPEVELFEDMELCSGDRDTLYVVDHSGNEIDIQWFKDQEELRAGPEHEVQNITQVGEYYVIGSTKACSDTSNRVYIKFITPQLNVVSSPQRIDLGESTTLYAQTNVESLSWYSETVDLNGITDSIIKISPEETSFIEVTGYWGDCSVEDTITIYVVKPYGAPYFFSPNGDGDNDVWIINDIDTYQSYSVEIYNRWGNRIRSYVNNYEPWNGENGAGVALPDGTYFYLIESRENGENIAIKGHVTIIR